MKSSEYWIKRSEQQLTDKLKDADKLNKRLNKHYKAAANQIAKDINVLYKRYMAENGLDQNMATQLIEGEEYRVWRMSMDEYLMQIDMAPEVMKEALILELNTLAMRSRITRLEAMQAEIKANMAILAQETEKEAGQLFEESLSNTYYENMYEYYKEDNPKVIDLMATHDVKLSKDNIDKVLTLPWSGKNYSKAIWDNAHTLSRRVESMVAQNIIAGTSIDRLTREMTKTMGKDKAYNIKRLLHTEIGYIKNQGDILTYNKLEVTKYQVLETLDKSTCDQCGSMDLKIFLVADAIPGKNLPPFHPYCRGTTVAVFGQSKSKTRIARDAAGNNIKVPRNMSYNQWKEYIGIKAA